MRSVKTFLVIALLVSACGLGSTSTSTGSELGSTSTAAAPTTTSTSVTSTSTTTTTTLPEPTIGECLARIPLEVRLGQLLLPIATQDELGAAADLAETGSIAGVVVLGEPDGDIAADIAALQKRSLIGPSIVAVDEEGGRVQRLTQLVGALPSARELAAAGTAEQARQVAKDHAEKIGELGFTMNLAPVLDLDNGTYIRDRSFSPDPDVVIDYGTAVAEGIIDAGLTPTAKHFPGHGRGIDSHTGLPTLPSLDELRSSDLLPFRAIAERGDVPIMIGHLVVTDLTDGEPATISPEVVTGLLRNELGFAGLVMTDAFNMDAIADRRGNDEATELALIAGVDLVMVAGVAQVEPTIERLVGAVAGGRLSEESVNASFLRVLDEKRIVACDVPADEEPAIRCSGITDGGCALSVG